MKKFGTPIGAGPGNANENDGFDCVGTPPEECCGVAFETFDLVFGLLAPVFGVEVWDGCWLFAGPVACGVVWVVVVVLVVEAVDEDVVVVDVLVVLDGDEVVVVAVVVLAVVDVDEHDSVSLRIGSVIGSEIADSGVPGATFTVNVYV